RARILPQSAVERVVGPARGDEDDCTRLEGALASERSDEALPCVDQDDLRVDRGLDAEVYEPLADGDSFLGVIEEGADDRERGHETDPAAPLREQLGDADAHEVSLAVVDEHRAA